MRYMKNVGDNGEEFAARLLEDMGYTILEKKFYTHYGEIDIVASKDGILHFIEVKTRTSNTYGYPADAITESKKKKLKQAVEIYMSRRRPFWRGYTLDVFEIMANLFVDCIG
ncbi:MAG: YraN family protein [Bacillota bacterium]|nr:YraN family protein [Bacillota bacterium]